MNLIELFVLMVIFAIVALGALAVAGFVVVNHARVYAQMIKANAEIADRAAVFSANVRAEVDRRVEIVTEMSKKLSSVRTKPLGPLEPEPPLPQEMRPYLHDEEAERAREIAEVLPFHPDAARRDIINE